MVNDNLAEIELMGKTRLGEFEYAADYRRKLFTLEKTREARVERASQMNQLPIIKADPRRN